MTVNDKIKEEASAKTIVSATGVNNLPSNLKLLEYERYLKISKIPFGCIVRKIK